MDRAISWSRGDEKVTQYAVILVYEKRNMGMGIIFARMNIGEYIIAVPCLEVIWCTFFLFVLFWHFRFLFGDFSTLPEDAAPELSSTITEALNSRLRSIIAPNLRSTPYVAESAAHLL